MGTYVFAHQNLTGQATSWTDEPPNPPSDVDVTGYSGDLTDLEFITPGAFCGVNVGVTNFSFPRTNASDTLTEENASTSANNNVFGYVIPADGTLLGFTVDLIAKEKFNRIVVWKNRGVTDIDLNSIAGQSKTINVSDPLIKVAQGLGIYVGEI